ncbi:hypothetical protein ACIQ9K_38780 [Streptomyces microflavus]|uniref:hypothetical protein n=1 Tax=Streptomyces microflavus TaxID=1919 RepID=UPI0038196165
MNAEFWVAFGTGVIALIALFHSSRAAAKARVKTIEDAYIARYWQILERFPSSALVGEEKADGASCDPEELRAVRLYLRLCEDELELRELGWVSTETWEQWRLGIRAQLNQWPVADEWALIRDGQHGRNQFTHLRQLDGDRTYDPRGTIVDRLMRRSLGPGQPRP